MGVSIKVFKYQTPIGKRSASLFTFIRILGVVFFLVNFHSHLVTPKAVTVYKTRISHGSRIHGKLYKSRTEQSRKYGFGSTLRNTDISFKPDEVNVFQSGQRDHGQMYIDSCTNFSLRIEFYTFLFLM